MTCAAKICPAYVIAHEAPDFAGALTPAEQYVAAFYYDLWVRPEQLFPAGAWRSIGFICGRGWGKTWAIAAYMNREIEAGRVRRPALIAPSLDRVDEVQIQALIDAAPPWFKPARLRKTIVWPNGVEAEVHTAENKNAGRGSNLDFLWATEIGAWPASTRVDAYNTITTAARNHGCRIAWDTTSQGRNEIILALERDADADPTHCMIVRGTTFDNPLLDDVYLASEVRKYASNPQALAEELGGKVFDGAHGALWSQTTINDTRQPALPEVEITILAVDPALSAAESADLFGIVKGSRGRDGHAYVTEDFSGHYTPDQWGAIVIRECKAGATGVIIETNRAGGEAQEHVVVSAAREAKMTTSRIGRDDPFPPRLAGHIHIKLIFTHTDKGTRAQGPASEFVYGRAHLVGESMRALELEMTTYVPGTKGQKSPNRYDALAHLVTELANLKHEGGAARAAEDARVAAAVSVDVRALLSRAARGGGRVGM